MKHHTVALLPMKANSERVTGKNFRDFCGKPLFRWMLDTLIAVTRIEKVVINTDARSILADHGLVEGGKIIIRDRPVEICGDHVSMNKVIADDISNVDADTLSDDPYNQPPAFRRVDHKSAGYLSCCP